MGLGVLLLKVGSGVTFLDVDSPAKTFRMLPSQPVLPLPSVDVLDLDGLPESGDERAGETSPLW
jgi:hypothetical protein